MTRQLVERECPKCKSPLGSRATYCGCGWTAEVKSGPVKSAGIGKCAWLANGEQCNYPGTMSHNTQGVGPWYCRFHAVSGISAHYGEQVVEQSRGYQPRPWVERDRAAVFDAYTGPKACQERKCVKHALKHSRFCLTHVQEAEQAALTPPREPGQDDEECAA